MRTADNCLSMRCGESPKLNQYGRQAMQHWQRIDPERYARIEDPQSFFSDLGNQAAAQILELSDSFAGRDQPGETYLDYARAHLRSARRHQQARGHYAPARSPRTPRRSGWPDAVALLGRTAAWSEPAERRGV